MSILLGREMRAKVINKYINNNGVIVGTANIPGPNKKKDIGWFLVDLFGKVCLTTFKENELFHHENDDGYFFVIKTKANVLVKEILIEIEETHPLGRLIDLDYYIKKDESLSRSDYGFKKRKCLLCNNDAVICVRNKNHPYQETLLKINEIIITFLKQEMRKIIDWAITNEAKLNPKFGLVTEYSQGSHHDMDYELLMKAKAVIIEPLVNIFITGFLLNEKEALIKARDIGIRAETAMFEITEGINVYKGLIFVLGFTLLAIGNCLQHSSFNLFQRIAKFGQNLLHEFTNDLTFGQQAYSKYGITGARGEVHSGLLTVQGALNILKDYSDASLTMTLINLITNAHDTVLLKRSGSIRKYYQNRERIAEIKEYNQEQIIKMTNYCVKHKLSFGGAADLLVCTLVIKKVEEIFQYKYEK